MNLKLIPPTITKTFFKGRTRSLKNLKNMKKVMYTAKYTHLHQMPLKHYQKNPFLFPISVDKGLSNNMRDSSYAINTETVHNVCSTIIYCGVFLVKRFHFYDFPEKALRNVKKFLTYLSVKYIEIGKVYKENAEAWKKFRNQRFVENERAVLSEPPLRSFLTIFSSGKRRKPKNYNSMLDCNFSIIGFLLFLQWETITGENT